MTRMRKITLKISEEYLMYYILRRVKNTFENQGNETKSVDLYITKDELETIDTLILKLTEV